MIIVRAENIEIAMQGFSNPSHKDRRRIIAEKSKPISLKDVSVQVFGLAHQYIMGYNYG